MSAQSVPMEERASVIGRVSRAPRFEQPGSLDVTLRELDGRARLAVLRQRFPLRTTVPLYLDPGDPGLAFIYVQNPTGGVFARDRLTLTLRLGDGARAHLTTQSATKLYRTDGESARQEMHLDLGPRAYLEYLPDPLIPHAGARFAQRLAVDLKPGARLISWEMLAPGRRACGERFAYDCVCLETHVYFGGVELCAERLEFEPARRSPAFLGLLADYDYVGSMLALAPGRDPDALADALDRTLAGCAGVLAGACTLPNVAGVLVRALSTEPRSLRTALTRTWHVARLNLLGLPAPPVRK